MFKGVSAVTYKPKVQRVPVERRTPRALSRYTHIARLRLFTRTQGHVCVVYTEAGGYVL